MAQEMKKNGYKALTEIVREVAIGNLICNLLLICGSLLLFRREVVFTVIAGLLLGMGIGDLGIWHLGNTVKRSLKEPDPMAAERIMRRSVILRLGLYTCVFVAVLWGGGTLIHPLAMVIGTMGVKAGIYMNQYGRPSRR